MPYPETSTAMSVGDEVFQTLCTIAVIHDSASLRKAKLEALEANVADFRSLLKAEGHDDKAIDSIIQSHMPDEVEQIEEYRDTQAESEPVLGELYAALRLIAPHADTLTQDEIVMYNTQEELRKLQDEMRKLQADLRDHEADVSSRYSSSLSSMLWSRLHQEQAANQDRQKKLETILSGCTSIAAAGPPTESSAGTGGISTEGLPCFRLTRRASEELDSNRRSPHVGPADR
jgi:hypothetical protein